MDAIDVLENLLGQVQALIGAQPCTCTVDDGGLQRCRRCSLLKLAGVQPARQSPRPSQDPFYLEARRRCNPERED